MCGRVVQASDPLRNVCFSEKSGSIRDPPPLPFMTLSGRVMPSVNRGSVSDERAVPCPLFGRNPPHCGGEHGQEDNWHPYEPRRAGIFSAHNAIEQRKAGQIKGCREAINGCSFTHPSDASHGPIAIPRTKPPVQRTHPGFAGTPGSPLRPTDQLDTAFLLLTPKWTLISCGER